MYNEKKDSIAKGIVLKDTLDIAEIEKDSVKIVDETGKDNYTIEEIKDKDRKYSIKC